MIEKKVPLGGSLCLSAMPRAIAVRFALYLLLLSSVSLLAPNRAIAEDADCSQTASLLARIEQLELRLEAMEIKVSVYDSLFGLVERQRLVLENVRKQYESDYKRLDMRLDKLQAAQGGSSFKPGRRRY